MGIVRADGDRAINENQHETNSHICQVASSSPEPANASQRVSSESFWRAIEALEAAEKAIPRPWQLPSK